MARSTGGSGCDCDGTIYEKGHHCFEECQGASSDDQWYEQEIASKPERYDTNISKAQWIAWRNQWDEGSKSFKSENTDADGNPITATGFEKPTDCPEGTTKYGRTQCLATDDPRITGGAASGGGSAGGGGGSGSGGGGGGSAEQQYFDRLVRQGDWTLGSGGWAWNDPGNDPSRRVWINRNSLKLDSTGKGYQSISDSQYKQMGSPGGVGGASSAHGTSAGQSQLGYTGDELHDVLANMFNYRAGIFGTADPNLSGATARSPKEQDVSGTFLPGGGLWWGGSTDLTDAMAPYAGIFGAQSSLPQATTTPATPETQTVAKTTAPVPGTTPPPSYYDTLLKKPKVGTRRGLLETTLNGMF